MKIFSILIIAVVAVAQPLADDEMEQYERTLGKRHPNRGTDEVRKMAREHMTATRSGYENSFGDG